MITLESEDKTYRELQRYMETLEDRLRRIESVSNLRRYGVQKEQISVCLLYTSIVILLSCMDL